MVRRGDQERDFYRFYENVLVGDGCWEWQASKHRRYGRFWVGGADGKTVRAHRWAYEYHVGPIPGGLQIDHVCENPSCVRWDHMVTATAKENMARLIASGRRCKTHCKRGHLFTNETLQKRKDGSRYCKVCQNAKRKAAYAAGKFTTPEEEK